MQYTQAIRDKDAGLEITVIWTDRRETVRVPMVAEAVKVGAEFAMSNIAALVASENNAGLVDAMRFSTTTLRNAAMTLFPPEKPPE